MHRLKSDRDLILGGVKIPFEKGLDGHSDADVLTHAIIDSLLGAAALGDIGKLFPDTDEKYRGANSLLLLKNVSELLKAHNYHVVNVDSTIIAQAPKLSPYIDGMRKNLADQIGIAIASVSVKATTEEHLGFTGRKEGIAAKAICLIESSDLSH